MAVVDTTVEAFSSLNLDSIPDGVQISFTACLLHLVLKLTVCRDYGLRIKARARIKYSERSQSDFDHRDAVTCIEKNVTG